MKDTNNNVTIAFIGLMQIIFIFCILIGLKHWSYEKGIQKGIQEGIRITREEAVEKRLGYFIITNKLTGASAFYWLSREGTNNLIQ